MHLPLSKKSTSLSILSNFGIQRLSRIFNGHHLISRWRRHVNQAADLRIGERLERLNNSKRHQTRRIRRLPVRLSQLIFIHQKSLRSSKCSNMNIELLKICYKLCESQNWTPFNIHPTKHKIVGDFFSWCSCVSFRCDLPAPDRAVIRRRITCVRLVSDFVSDCSVFGMM